MTTPAPNFDQGNVVSLQSDLGKNVNGPLSPTGQMYGGGGGDGMNEIYCRLGALEAGVQNLGTSISEVKSDIRKLLAAGILATVLVIGALISSHLILAGNVDSARKEITDLIRYEVGRLSVPEVPKD